MLGKIIIIILMVAILLSLLHAMVCLVYGKNDKKGTVRGLSWRIGLSILAFILLFVFNHFGWIEMHSLKSQPPQSTLDTPAKQ